MYFSTFSSENPGNRYLYISCTELLLLYYIQSNLSNISTFSFQLLFTQLSFIIYLTSIIVCTKAHHNTKIQTTTAGQFQPFRNQPAICFFYFYPILQIYGKIRQESLAPILVQYYIIQTAICSLICPS